MIAKIIVDKRSKQVDKTFDYEVPKELESQMKIGSRVIVPFSKGNTELEGFCMGFSEKSKVKNLKSVLKITSGYRAFDEKMLEIIEWMHDRYLASYLDIIHTIIPTGTDMKSTEWIVPGTAGNGRTERQKQILGLIEQNGGRMTVEELAEKCDFDVRAAIRRMITNGMLAKEYTQSAEVSDITQKCVRLVDKPSSTEEMLALLNRNAYIQADVIKILAERGEMLLTDLNKYIPGASGAARALEKKGLAEIYDRELRRNPFTETDIKMTAAPEPTYEQARAISEIEHSLNEDKSEVFLLHGVTGSGKTEVFMQSIDTVLKASGTAMVLVPEISLTPQLVSRFVSRFGDRVAILHSALSMGERYDQWKKIKDGGADIVIGARSAVFAPLDNIKLIVLDEEHSDTYKSEITPRYHARDVALKRAEQYGAKVILASATPSAESMYRARNGEYTLLEMKTRYNKNVMPQITIVDMRKELAEGNRSIFSERLKSEIGENLTRGEQTILFLNRRGFSTFVSCRACGYVAKCPSCSISLTYHRVGNVLRCHYCGYTRENYKICPVCRSKYIRYFGGGTQKVESEVHSLFPNASVIRMDIDTTSRKNSHAALLKKFETEKTDILIGTQMVAKGLDFENVTLVGVVTADTMLNIHDYRSSERTFAMLEQVSGRAGRGEKRGRAVIQTYSPESAAIKLVKEHNYGAFYESEILQRKIMWYPPYSEIVSVMFSSSSQTLSQQSANFFLKQLGDLSRVVSRYQILGPTAAALSKIKNKYRYQIIIKCDDSDKLNDALRAAESACRKHKNYSGVAIVTDKNPNML